MLIKNERKKQKNSACLIIFFIFVIPIKILYSIENSKQKHLK